MKTIFTLFFTMLCFAVVAQGTPGLAFSFVWGSNETEYQVGRGSATATHIEIPSTHNGLPVTRIIPNGFREFTVMTSINIPNTVTIIESAAFRECIGLTTITIPNSVTTIGQSAFEYCTGLTSIYIPNSVESIGGYAFRGCTSLTSVTIPNSVTVILTNPFSRTPNLETIYVEAGNTHFRSDGNCLIRNHDNRLISGTRNSIIPNGVTTIGVSAFEECTGLISINIPNSVTTIDSEAFRRCTGLTHITLSNSLASIGSSAFRGCTGLTSITIPGSVTSIGSSAFDNCTSLTSITISNGLITIGSWAFEHCTSLTSITIPNSVTSIGNGAFLSCSSLTIYAEAPSQPTGWHENWNPDNRPVVWGHVSDCDTTEEFPATQLIGNYPNPFNPTTTFNFSVAAMSPSPQWKSETSATTSHVRIDVYNVRGQKVLTLVDSEYETGEHSVVWNGTDDSGRVLCSGVYLYRMSVGGYTSVRRMILLK